MRNDIVLIGYSGHAFVVADSIENIGLRINGYCDHEEKVKNPFNLTYYGPEDSDLAKEILRECFFFITIGDNKTREKVYQKLVDNPDFQPISNCHSSAFISKHASIGFCTYVGANAAINAFAEIGKGVICNTQCIIEHECKIGDFVHIAPGTVLAGNVTVGARSFIGANSVIKQGINIGKDVVVGAGSVVIRDVPDNSVVAGVPAKNIQSSGHPNS